MWASVWAKGGYRSLDAKRPGGRPGPLRDAAGGRSVVGGGTACSDSRGERGAHADRGENDIGGLLRFEPVGVDDQVVAGAAEPVFAVVGAEVVDAFAVGALDDFAGFRLAGRHGRHEAARARIGG